MEGILGRRNNLRDCKVVSGRRRVFGMGLVDCRMTLDTKERKRGAED